MKVIKLDIDEENEFEGIDAVALVAEPAIELDFQFFSKQHFAETYNDYPKAARKAAEQGIKRNKAIKNMITANKMIIPAIDQATILIFCHSAPVSSVKLFDLNEIVSVTIFSLVSGKLLFGV